jgi:Zn finger protein HypA/HybF involved in hydrogenase expression
MPKKLNNKIFIQRAKENHREKYTYEKVDYKNSYIKVIITCRIHGDFEQSPNSHLYGQGCPDCSGRKKLDNKIFIQRAKEKHGEKYTYHNVNYKRSDIKVKITCPQHGDFEQTPDSHLRSQGCPNCKKIDNKIFIQRAKEKHGEKYIYDKVEFINNTTDVIIICPYHGEFPQSPPAHWKGHGCPKCSNVYKPTTKEFIERAKSVHGDRYNYENTIYVSAKKNVKIICPFHGEFNQSPYHHCQGVGCPNCRMSKGESKIETFLTLRNIKYECQHSFSDCVYKARLKFDFAIFINNKIGLIEYQGIQHYTKTDFGKGITNLTFEENIKRDKIKVDYAKSKKIPLLVIHHNEFDKIESMIEDFVGSF